MAISLSVRIDGLKPRSDALRCSPGGCELSSMWPKAAPRSPACRQRHEYDDRRDTRALLAVRRHLPLLDCRFICRRRCRERHTGVNQATIHGQRLGQRYCPALLASRVTMARRPTVSGSRYCTVSTYAAGRSVVPISNVDDADDAIDAVTAAANELPAPQEPTDCALYGRPRDADQHGHRQDGVQREARAHFETYPLVTTTKLMMVMMNTTAPTASTKSSSAAITCAGEAFATAELLVARRDYGRLEHTATADARGHRAVIMPTSAGHYDDAEAAPRLHRRSRCAAAPARRLEPVDAGRGGYGGHRPRAPGRGHNATSTRADGRQRTHACVRARHWRRDDGLGIPGHAPQWPGLRPGACSADPRAASAYAQQSGDIDRPRGLRRRYEPTRTHRPSSCGARHHPLATRPVQNATNDQREMATSPSTAAASAATAARLRDYARDAPTAWADGRLRRRSRPCIQRHGRRDAATDKLLLRGTALEASTWSSSSPWCRDRQPRWSASSRSRKGEMPRPALGNTANSDAFARRGARRCRSPGSGQQRRASTRARWTRAHRGGSGMA